MTTISNWNDVLSIISEEENYVLSLLASSTADRELIIASESSNRNDRKIALNDFKELKDIPNDINKVKSLLNTELARKIKECPSISLNPLDGLEALFLEKETLEFKINIFKTQFEFLKKTTYNDMMIYERKKVFHPELLPNTTVLAQLKIFEADVSVKEFKQILVSLNRELSDITTIIDTAKSNRNKMFSFKEINVKNYILSFVNYFDEKVSFDYIIKSIHNNEFLNNDTILSCPSLKNYDMLNKMYLEIPTIYKSFAKILLEEAKYLYFIEILEVLSPEDVVLFIESESEQRNNRKSEILMILQIISNTESNTIKNRTALDDSLSDIPTKIASDFIRSRLDADASLISKIENASIARGDWITKEGLYIKSTAVKWTNKK